MANKRIPVDLYLEMNLFVTQKVSHYFAMFQNPAIRDKYSFPTGSWNDFPFVVTPMVVSQLLCEIEIKKNHTQHIDRLMELCELKTMQFATELVNAMNGVYESD